MYPKIFFLSLLSAWSLVTSAQSPTAELSAIVTYERKSFWIKIADKLPYLSQEEKDRAKLTWGKNDGYAEKYTLKIEKNQSLYELMDDDEAGNSWPWGKEDLIFFRDFNAMKQTNIFEMMNANYVLEDELVFPKWKILNEIKEVAGYLCMKAETRDTLKGQIIHAWFAEKIPTQAGPEMMGGLPGLILGLDINNGATTVEATKIEFEKVSQNLALPKKISGKKINTKSYQKLIGEHISDCTKAKRNPFWSLRY